MSVDQHQDLDQHRQTGIYVYGLVPADVEADPEAKGVGDPPAAVEVVRHGDIAALTSEIPTDHQLGRPDDLRAHAELLDRAAAEVPVLPIRFGGVMASADAVIKELLEPYHDEFRSALDELDGSAEFLVRGRYVEDTLFKEILSENEEAAALREQIRGKPEDATRNERIALGELIDGVIAAKREADTRTAVNVVFELTEKVSIREATHEHEAVHVACLLETGRQAELEHVVDDLSDMWRDRISLSLQGPMAAYDFVVTHQPEE